MTVLTVLSLLLLDLGLLLTSLCVYLLNSRVSNAVKLAELTDRKRELEISRLRDQLFALCNATASFSEDTAERFERESGKLGLLAASVGKSYSPEGKVPASYVDSSASETAKKK